MEVNDPSPPPSCLQALSPQSRLYQPQAEDILTDEDLLDLFRIVKQVIRKKPDTDKLAKLLFCVSYALGDHVKFYKPLHDDRIVFREELAAHNHAVRLASSSSCCNQSGSNASSSSSAAMPNAMDSALLGKEMQLLATSPSTVSSVASTSQHESPITRLLNVPLVSCTAPSPSPAQQVHVGLSPHLSSTATPPSSSQPLHAHNTPPQHHQHQHHHASPLPPPHHAHASHLPHSSPQPPNLQQQPQQHEPGASSAAAAAAAAAAAGVDLGVMAASSDETSTDPFTVRPYTNFRPLYPSIPSHTSFERGDPSLNRYPSHADPAGRSTSPQLNQDRQQAEILMEPKQRGFYYQDGRISREPVLLQRYAEQGILTQASLMRKRKRQSTDTNVLYDMNQPPAPTKKPKIPHRHGEFEQRRDDIINRMRTLTFQDLEQKAQRVDFALVIDRSPAVDDMPSDLPKEEAAKYLEPALRILTSHSNMKPHLDNGMNQNGIYYNSDYFRLYMAFEQFQKTFAQLFPNEVITIPEEDLSGDLNTTPVSNDRDKDRERNANMKAYRGWIEPLLTETNWAAFRRNIVVGERIMQLTKVVGQGVLLMTKELSGSKLHLTFTNNEWDEFITGLSSGRWDQTIQWDQVPDAPPLSNKKSRLVMELRRKYTSAYWFNTDGTMVSPKDRKLLYRSAMSSSSPAAAAASTPTTLSTAMAVPSPSIAMKHDTMDEIQLLGDMMR
ncbi:hypothetical protein BC940DRAFT_369371 [Gongronella butleri]|nr:hypothetical protein BC940DRAFT_369371 [Gongronella butleri]